ncbi:MAG: hypothetical protein KF782_27595 [Labilithrix sp.]|nr:hypothetical protein [Labilithrix sp.]
MRARLLAAAAVLSFACGACVLVFGMDPLTERAADGGPDEAPLPDAADESREEAGACVVDRIALPDRPTTSPKTEDGSLSFFLFSSLDLGINPADGRPGFDLDRHETVDLADNGCALFAGGDPNETLRRAGDTDGGVDNTTYEMLQLLRYFVRAFDPERINARLDWGYYGVVLGVARWNGTPNDDDVLVQVIPTNGYWEAPSDGGALFWNREARPLDFDAGDKLMPDMRFLSGTAGSTLTSAAGWINDGKLVARFNRLTVPVRSSVDDLRPFDLKMADAWLAATIVDGVDGGVATLRDGTVAGRIHASSFLSQASLVYDDQSGAFLCARVTGETSEYLCNARDIRSSHCDDDRNLPCDALSFGARFEATAIPKDAIGPHRARLDSDYVEKGQTPPSQRCPDLDAALECP